MPRDEDGNIGNIGITTRLKLKYWRGSNAVQGPVSPFIRD